MGEHFTYNQKGSGKIGDSIRGAQPDLPGGCNPHTAGSVWLPVTLKGKGEMEIRWRDSWDLSVFDKYLKTRKRSGYAKVIRQTGDDGRDSVELQHYRSRRTDEDQ